MRLELPEQYLHLQSIGLETADGSDATSGIEVTASSWYRDYGEKFDPARLFDWDHPDGTVIHTEKDELSWVELRFARPVQLTGIRLRNVRSATATRAQRVRVVVRTRWRQRVVFDGAARHKQLRAAVAAHDLGDADPQVQALVPVLVDTFRGAYAAARKAVHDAELDPDLVKAFRGVVNAELLPSRQLLWTIHGPTRSFRFCTPAEQTAYVQFAAEVAEALREVTPHVCFGFGAVLSVVRDRALIPDDDDLDIIIGFEPDEAATLADWPGRRDPGTGGTQASRCAATTPRTGRSVATTGASTSTSSSGSSRATPSPGTPAPGAHSTATRCTPRPPPPCWGSSARSRLGPRPTWRRCTARDGTRPTRTSPTAGTARPTPTSPAARPRPTHPTG